MSTPEFVKGTSGPLQQWESGGQTIVPTYLGGSSSSQTTTVTPSPGGAASYRKATQKVVNTTISATDLLNGEITIAASALGTTGEARLVAVGDWKQNSGGAQSVPRFQLVLGGTTIIDTGNAGTAVDAATRYGWAISARIAERETPLGQQEREPISRWRACFQQRSSVAARPERRMRRQH